MGMTITEKILAAHAGVEEVSPGELIDATADVVMGNDVTIPMAYEIMRREGLDSVFDPDKIIAVADHFTPSPDIASATQCKLEREFVHRYRISHFYDVGRVGIEHALLPEQGLVLPGDLIVGGDSHTCTYGALGAFSTGVGSTDLAAAIVTGRVWLRVPETMKFVITGPLERWVSGKDLILHVIGRIGVDGALYRAMEFSGDTISRLGMDGRFTMCNMAVEAGAKNGIIAPDGVTLDYTDGRKRRDYKVYASDEDAGYAETHEISVAGMPPQVACPNRPDNVVPVGELGDVRIDQSVIGSCTNGRLSDLEVAAEVLKGRKVHPDVRLIVVPATPEIFREAIRRGYVEVFLDAGAAVSTPTCGPCMGGHMGVLAAGECAVSTTNRNFVGRMGDPGSRLYLSNPAVAAASAVKGKICSPDDLR